MKPILFACDLDNTLIRSYKHRREGDLCVEWIDGKEQGYMSPEVCELLRQAVQAVELVPVTTRSVAQYQRIVWPEGCRPRRAITTHGATLLCGEAPDSTWMADTRRLTEPLLPALQRIVADLDATGLYLRCRMVDDAYAFVYCSREERSMETAMAWPLPEGVYRIRSGKKIYFIPVGIDKGCAVRRFRQPEHRTLVCAGDSDMDVAMLDVADVALCPAALAGQLNPQGQLHACSDDAFGVELLQKVLEIASRA